jgi:hypothetical protein
MFFLKRGKPVPSIETHSVRFPSNINRLLICGPLARLMHVICV